LWRISKHMFRVKQLFFPKNLALYEIIFKNMKGPDRLQTTIKYGAEKIRFACWITKARIQIHTDNF